MKSATCTTLRPPPRRSASTVSSTTVPTARLIQAPREYESTTPRTSNPTIVPFHSARRLKSRGVSASSSRINAIGTRNGPNMFGSSKSAWTRPALTKSSPPGNGASSASTPSCGRCDGSGQVPAHDDSCTAWGIDETAEPERGNGQVHADPEVHGRRAVIDDLDGGQEAERQEAPERDECRRRRARPEPARYDRYGYDDQKHEIRRRGLDEHDREQRESHESRGFDMDDGEGDHREETEAEGELGTVRRRVARQRESGDDGEENRAREHGEHARRRRRDRPGGGKCALVHAHTVTLPPLAR